MSHSMLFSGGRTARLVVAVLVAALAAFAGLATVAGPASARLSWCFGDPVVEIGGQRVDINVLVPEEHLDAVQSPVLVEVHVPAGVPYHLVEMNSPYFEEEVTFIEEPGWAWEAGRPFRAEARVFVTGSEEFRVKVEVTFDRENGREKTITSGGRSNRWVSTTFRPGK